jgi:formylglycine-generating enzyme required for sulfatase activity
MIESKRGLIKLIAPALLCASVSLLVFAQGGDPRKNTNSTTTSTKKPATTRKTPPRRPKSTTTSLSNMPSTRTNDWTKMEFVLIRPGRFMMGSISDESTPVHQVTIKYPFYMGKYEVTQSQWQEVMGNNPSNFKRDNLPVERVSWLDAISFVARLNAASNDGITYRLPSEAEWEYACRAGTTGNFAGINLDAMAWYANNSGRAGLDVPSSGPGYYRRLTENGAQTHPVGAKLPNAFGLYDMHGNVWEWCQDWYHETYEGAPTDGSAWVTGDELASHYRVLRGGSWADRADELTSSWRLNDSGPMMAVNREFGTIGFRVVAIARTQ